LYTKNKLIFLLSADSKAVRRRPRKHFNKETNSSKESELRERVFP
jgi:hypothetical protein